MEIKKVVSENAKRLARINSVYQPHTGEGGYGERIVFHLPDSPIPLQYIPKTMAEVELVQLLQRYGSIKKFITEHLKVKPTDSVVDEVWKHWIKIRIKYDFEFWAVMFVRIKNKMGDSDIAFKLNSPQRRLLGELEDMRLADKPIRIILLKARQWGGSTLVQIYMAWIQLVHRKNWNSVICAHLKDSALNIKGMYTKLLENYPSWLLDSEEPIKFQPFERMANTSIISATKSKITIGSAETPESVRGTDAVMAHLSEVAFWNSTQRKTPESMVRSVCGSVALLPLSVIVMESTANGTGNYFHKECMRAKRGESDKKFVFVPWFEIEIYSMPVANHKEFAESLSKYEWELWNKGATLEAIAWYREKRKEYSEHADMMAEYPSDDVEAFNYSGEKVFSHTSVERLRKECCKPKYVGDIYGRSDRGKEALTDVRFIEESGGELRLWEMPDEENLFSMRYITVVDIGGRSNKADYSVIVVFDRYWMLHGGVPEVVAQWRGHIDHDLLAWKAVQIAEFYNKSLLVIESNTLETERGDDDSSEYILETVSGVYPNLYARQTSNMIHSGSGVRWGFHMNRATKLMLIAHQVRMLREGGYIERDFDACYEHDVFERKQNGAYGAMEGHHDDILITRCIGTYICYTEPLPQLNSSRVAVKGKIPISEATI